MSGYEILCFKSEFVGADENFVTTILTMRWNYVTTIGTLHHSTGSGVQECPEARTAIKFLVEDGRFDYIESGSLMGVYHKEAASYPVGFEELCQMYSMDFKEFLWANGVQPSTVDYLHGCFDTLTPVSQSVHEMAGGESLCVLPGKH